MSMELTNSAMLGSWPIYPFPTIKSRLLSLAFVRSKLIPRDSFLSKRSQGEPIYGDDVIVSYKVVNRTLFSSASVVTVALIATNDARGVCNGWYLEVCGVAFKIRVRMHANPETQNGVTWWQLRWILFFLPRTPPMDYVGIRWPYIQFSSWPSIG